MQVASLNTSGVYFCATLTLLLYCSCMCVKFRDNPHLFTNTHSNPIYPPMLNYWSSNNYRNSIWAHLSACATDYIMYILWSSCTLLVVSSLQHTSQIKQSWCHTHFRNPVSLFYRAHLCCTMFFLAEQSFCWLVVCVIFVHMPHSMVKLILILNMCEHAHVTTYMSTCWKQAKKWRRQVNELKRE